MADPFMTTVKASRRSFLRSGRHVAILVAASSAADRDTASLISHACKD